MTAGVESYRWSYSTSCSTNAKALSPLAKCSQTLTDIDGLPLIVLGKKELDNPYLQTLTLI